VRQFTLSVAEIATSGRQIYVRCGGGPEVTAVPGQFYLARADRATQPFLRVPLYPFHAYNGGLEFFVDPAHPYAALEPGDTLDLVGPCGHGFSLPPRAAHLLLVAGALERLYSLAHLALERHFSVTLLLPPPPDAPPSLEDPRSGVKGALPVEIEIQRGTLTADLAVWADLVAVDVPDPLTFTEGIRRLRLHPPPGFVQALITPTMPCGVGACQACWVEVGASRRLACVHGPVFEM
jgi:dihydroorotate dehydrogenase electron transfer subunit